MPLAHAITRPATRAKARPAPVRTVNPRHVRAHGLMAASPVRKLARARLGLGDLFLCRGRHRGRTSNHHQEMQKLQPTWPRPRARN